MRTRLSILLVFVLVLSVASSPAGGVAGFGDIDVDKYFTEPVQWMVDNSITGGTSPTCFSPGDAVTRGQAAAFMWRMEGSPTGAPPHSFTDVFAAWQQVPVSWMVEQTITTGTSTKKEPASKRPATNNKHYGCPLVKCRRRESNP